MPGLSPRKAMASRQSPPAGAPVAPAAARTPPSSSSMPTAGCRDAAPSRTEAKDPRLRPSEASGGVPEPSRLYLAQSSAPPATLPQPRRILVILDLNGTLLFRPTRRQPTRFVERAHARTFMAYCLDTFYLAVWSSARPENVNHMLAQLLTDEQRRRCVVVWGRDRFGLCLDDYNTRVQCYKRLSTLWDNAAVQATHPAAARGARWDQSNTVLVDDSLEKGRSEPHNILQIPEFHADRPEPADVLPQVHDYLNLLCHQADVSRYMRRNPFALDPHYRLPASATSAY